MRSRIVATMKLTEADCYWVLVSTFDLGLKASWVAIIRARDILTTSDRR